MKKVIAKKKPAAKKKTAPAKKAITAKKVSPVSTATTPPLETLPQSKQQAATQAGVFLHTDDQWSLAYFNSGDLHCEERELFG